MEESQKICNPLISVVIPVYNRQKVIGRLLEALEQQTYSNMQEMEKQFKNRIAIFMTYPNHYLTYGASNQRVSKYSDSLFHSARAVDWKCC